MNKLLLALLVAIAVSACAPAVDPNVRAAMAAGEEVLRTLKTCAAHFQKTKEMNIPQCDASVQTAAYREAKKKVFQAVPALDALDQEIFIETAGMVAAINGWGPDRIEQLRKDRKF